MGNLNFQEWKLRSVIGAVKEYIRGVKKEAPNIKRYKIMLIIVTVIGLIIFALPHVRVLAMYDSSGTSSCVEDYMYVPVIILNAPWSGRAEYTKQFYTRWEFGSIVTSYKEFSWSETTRVFNGVNAIEYVFAKVKVCGNYAEVLQWFENIRYATNYESQGDKVDDTCLALVTVICDTNGNCRTSGRFTACPTYSSFDAKLTYCNGYEKSFEITVTNGVAAGVDISISMGPFSINGIFRTNILVGSTEKVIYDIVAPQNACATWYIDYLKALAQTPIWAFNVIDPPQQAVTPSSRRADKMCVMRLELEEVVVNATSNNEISRTKKPFKDIIIVCPSSEWVKISFVNDKAIVFIDNEVHESVKSVVWRIWYKAGYKWRSVTGVEPQANLTLRDVYGVVLSRVEGYSTTIIVEVLLKDGTRMIEEIGIGGYAPEKYLS
jgi:hypothetical protein